MYSQPQSIAEVSVGEGSALPSLSWPVYCGKRCQTVGEGSALPCLPWPVYCGKRCQLCKGVPCPLYPGLYIVGRGVSCGRECLALCTLACILWEEVSVREGSTSPSVPWPVYCGKRCQLGKGVPRPHCALVCILWEEVSDRWGREYLVLCAWPVYCGKRCQLGKGVPCPLYPGMYTVGRGVRLCPGLYIVGRGVS